MRTLGLAPLVLALTALLNGAPSWAGASGAVTVGITLSRSGVAAPSSSSTAAPLAPASGLCRSRTLSEATGASVEVACRTGQFVSIAPQPGAPYLGVHGGAFRYSIALRTELAVWEMAVTGEPATLGWGTVTALRIYDLTPPQAPGEGAWDRPLELLVGF